MLIKKKGKSYFFNMPSRGRSMAVTKNWEMQATIQIGGQLTYWGPSLPMVFSRWTIQQIQVRGDRTRCQRCNSDISSSLTYCCRSWALCKFWCVRLRTAHSAALFLSSFAERSSWAPAVWGHEGAEVPHSSPVLCRCVKGFWDSNTAKKWICLKASRCLPAKN